MKRIIVGLLAAMLLISMAPQTNLNAYAGDDSAQTATEAVSDNGSNAGDPAALLKRAPGQPEKYNGVPKPSMGTTDLYVSVKDENKKAIDGAEVGLYEYSESTKELTPLGKEIAGKKGYAYFGSSYNLDPKKQYVAKVENAADYGYEADKLTTQPFSVKKTAMFPIVGPILGYVPVNVMGFVLSDNDEISQGLTITTWLIDEDSYRSSNPEYIKGDDVTFCLTDDLGNTTYMHANEEGLAVFDGLSAARTYSVSLAKVPIGYADDKAIEDINNEKDHNNIPVYVTQLFNYSGFVIQKTPQLFNFDVTELGDSSVPIKGAVFELSYDSPYVSDKDKTVYFRTKDDIEGNSDDNLKDGTLYIAKKDGDSYKITETDRDASGIKLANGSYTLKQISSDSEHNKITNPVHFTVNGRGELISIENERKDYTKATTDITVKKVWGNDPGKNDKEQNPTAEIELQRAVLGSDEYSKAETGGILSSNPQKTTYNQAVTHNGEDNGKKSSTVTFKGVRKYDNYGNRYIYRVSEETSKGWYGIISQEDSDNFTITNYKGNKETTYAENSSHWVSSSSAAYLIKVENGKPNKVIKKLIIGGNGGPISQHGHEIAYTKGEDGHGYLYGVSNPGEIIRIKDPEKLDSVYNSDNRTYNESYVHKTKITGMTDGPNYVGPQIHTMEFTRDGQNLIVAGQFDTHVYIIPKSYVDKQIESGSPISVNDSGVTSIDVGNVLNTSSNKGSFDGDIIETPDGDLLFTAGEGNVYRMKKKAGGGWEAPSKTPVASVDPTTETGQPVGRTVEGLLYIEDTLYFTATQGSGKSVKGYIYPLVKDSDDSYHVNNDGRFELTANDDGSIGGFTSLTGATSYNPITTPDTPVESHVSKIWAGDEADKTTRKPVVVQLWTRDENGNDTLYNNGEVTRTLSEKNKWRYSTLDDNITLPREINGKEVNYVWHELTQVDGYNTSIDADGHVITNTYRNSEFSFKKVDSKTGDPLAGVEFTLTSKSNSSLKYTATSKGDGTVTFKNVKPGEYTLEETSVPSGYEKPSAGYTVEIKAADKKKVPVDINGMTEDEAREALNDSGLNAVFIKSGTETGTGAGNWYVDSTDPGAGRTTYDGTNVKVTLKYQDLIQIPLSEVVGKTLDEAKETLGHRDLNGTPSSNWYNRPSSDGDWIVESVTLPDGSTATADSKVEPGSTVTLKVAWKGKVNVPNVSGMTQDEASDALKSRQLIPAFEYDNTSKPSGSTVGTWKVGSTDPAIGSTVYKGSNIKVTLVWEGEKTTVPDVSGMTQDEARDALTSSQLIPAFEYDDTSKTDKNGTWKVGWTNPDKRTVVYKGSSVTATLVWNEINAQLSEIKNYKGPSKDGSLIQLINDKGEALTLSSGKLTYAKRITDVSNPDLKTQLWKVSALSEPVKNRIKQFKLENYGQTGQFITAKKNKTWYPCVDISGSTIQFNMNNKGKIIITGANRYLTSNMDNNGIIGTVNDRNADDATPFTVYEYTDGSQNSPDSANAKAANFLFSNLALRMPSAGNAVTAQDVGGSGTTTQDWINTAKPTRNTGSAEFTASDMNIKITPNDGNTVWYTKQDADGTIVQYVANTKETLSLNIKKIGNDTASAVAGLKGAEFDLYESASSGDEGAVKVPGTEILGVSGYGIQRNDESLKTGDNGRFTIDNLTPNKTYYLVETKAPNGYRTPSSPTISFSVHKDANGKVVISGSRITTLNDTGNQAENAKLLIDDNSMYIYGICKNGSTLYVKNLPAYELPKAGGMGTYLFTIAGTAMISIVVLMFWAMKRREQYTDTH